MTMSNGRVFRLVYCHDCGTVYHNPNLGYMVHFTGGNGGEISHGRGADPLSIATDHPPLMATAFNQRRVHESVIDTIRGQ